MNAVPSYINSCLYKCKISHHRLEPKRHSFNYLIYLFYIDLDEIGFIHKNLILISHNRFNLFNFRDKDHLKTDQWGSGNLKQKVLKYVSENGINSNEVGKIMLLTNTNTLGYIFNPVSFYFLFNKHDEPICNITEVSNTFNEMKTYFIDKQYFNGYIFKYRKTKHFYVSPFIDHDAEFDFELEIPGEALNIKIDDYKNESIIFKSSLSGVKVMLSDRALLYYFSTIPLVTVKIITAIYWQALKLFLKRIKYHKKLEYIELQKDVLNPHHSLIHAGNHK